MKREATDFEKCGEPISVWCFIKRRLSKLIRPPAIVNHDESPTVELDILNDPEVHAEKLHGCLAGYHSCPDCGGRDNLFWIYKFIPFPKNPKRLKKVDTKEMICNECGKYGSCKTFDWHYIPH